MHILVTRPEPDASETKAALESAGHTVTLSPLLNIDFEPITDIGQGSIQAIVVTSRNALRALSKSPLLADLRDLPVFAVGPRSARDVHDLGFHGVIEGPGNAAGLPDCISANSDPRGGRLLHLAGYRLAFDLEEAMSSRGYDFESLPCYRASPATSLPPQARDAIASGSLDAVLLMSPDSARTYVRLVGEAGLSRQAESIAAICISAATAAALPPLPVASIQVADRPNSEEVLALINRMAEQSK